MDLLSNVLSLVNMKSTSVSGLETGGRWAINYPIRFNGVKFGAMVRGSCYLKADNLKYPVQIKEGDCFLLTDAGSYWFGSDVKLKGLPGLEVFKEGENRIVSLGKKRDSLLVGGRITFDESHASLLKNALPPLIHIPSKRDEAKVLNWALLQMSDELSQAKPGQALMIRDLAQILFVQVLRSFLEGQKPKLNGWLGAFSNPGVLAALNLMHSQLAKKWTLLELAKHAGMSRTSFVQQFKSCVGSTPLDYLLSLKMKLASQVLLLEKKKVSEVAFQFGYESESAFSSAFKRVVGKSPKHFQLSSTKKS